MTYQEILREWADKHKGMLGYQDMIWAAHAGAKALDVIGSEGGFDDSSEDDDVYSESGSYDLGLLYSKAMALGLSYDTLMTGEELTEYINEKQRVIK